MNRFSRTLVLAGLSLVTVAMAAQDGATLRRSLKENSTETYKIDSKSTQTVNLPNGLGEQEVSVNSASTFKFTTGKADPDKGNIGETVESTVDKFDVEGPTAGQVPTPKPIKLSGTLDEKGHISLDLSAVTMAQAQNGAGQTTSSGMFVEFPDKPVKIGDSWDIVIPKSVFTGSEDQKITAKLIGEKTVDNVGVWVVSLSGTLKLDIDSSKLKKDPDAEGPAGGQDIHMTGTSETTSECLVDKATGRTVRSDSKWKMKGTVEIIAMGISVDISGTSTTTSILQK